jgi:hypothetical protein
MSDGSLVHTRALPHGRRRPYTLEREAEDHRVAIIARLSDDTPSVGDVVIWDNTGTVHRAMPFDPASGREMHRTTWVGDEEVQ